MLNTAAGEVFREILRSSLSRVCLSTTDAGAADLTRLTSGCPEELDATESSRNM